MLIVLSELLLPGNLNTAYAQTADKTPACNWEDHPATISRTPAADQGNSFGHLEQFARSEDNPSAHEGPVYAAARKLNYRPDFFASNLRARRAFAVGVITAEIAMLTAPSSSAGSKRCSPATSTSLLPRRTGVIFTIWISTLPFCYPGGSKESSPPIRSWNIPCRYQPCASRAPSSQGRNEHHARP